MADEKGYTIPIYITPIQGQNSGGSESSGGDEYLPMKPAEKGQESQTEAVEKAKSAGNGAKAFARQLAGKVATTALNNFGNITGDYIAQQNMQAAIGEVAAISSAAALGPAGIAMYGVQKALDVFNYVSQLKRSEAESKFKQKRVYATEKKS